MRVDKKRFIYLISPNKIKKSFYSDLKVVFDSNLVSFFQLRLKKYSLRERKKIGIKIKKICKKYKVKLIINDDPNLAKKIGADGCHLGQKDMKYSKARKIIREKIIGITCHNSKTLINKFIKLRPSYIAIGAFFKSTTKRVRYKANISLLKYAKSVTKIPIVTIGGINNKNYKKLLLNNANFLAISGYIWNNKKYKPYEAIEKLK